MYLWLKQGTEEQVEALKRQDLGYFEVRSAKSGEKYLSTHDELGDPTRPALSERFTNLVERVTVRETINRGLRTEGVYRYSGATLTAKTNVWLPGFSEPEEGLVAQQELFVSGPNIEALEAIYTLFRQGKLVPAEPWEDVPTVKPASSWLRRLIRSLFGTRD